MVGTIFGCIIEVSITWFARLPGRMRRRAPLDPAEQPAVVKRVLLVDRAVSMLLQMRGALPSDVHVTTSNTFEDARRQLLSRPPDLLVTNLRLEAYNGLHLVYLAANSFTRSIVYAEPHDAALAREAQVAGAFYERAVALPYALDRYVRATLPERDRRSVGFLTRRDLLPGGRRAADHAPTGEGGYENHNDFP